MRYSELPATTAAATTATATATALLARLRFVDAQGSPLQFDAVHGLDRRLGIRIVRHLDKGKAAGAAGVAVSHDLRTGDLAAILFERFDQVVFGSIKREVANIKSHTHHSKLFNKGESEKSEAGPT